jgi:hypothetical protein
MAAKEDVHSQKRMAHDPDTIQRMTMNYSGVSLSCKPNRFQANFESIYAHGIVRCGSVCHRASMVAAVTYSLRFETEEVLKELHVRQHFGCYKNKQNGN